MSSTVIDQHHARPNIVAMDEERISSDSFKLALEKNGDIQTMPKTVSSESSSKCHTSPGSLHSVATALTNLVKSTTTSSNEMQCDDKSEDFEIPLRFTKSGRKRAIPFPLKLMKVLSQAEFTDIITWLPDGKSFTILKPKAFVSEILSKESGLGFKQAKYSSFTRKLHRWGFMRHYRGDEAGAFYHKLFVRDRLDLVEKMTCNKVEPPKFASVAADNTAPKPKAPVPAAVAAAAAAPGKVTPKPLSAPTLPRAGAVVEHLRQAPTRSMLPHVPLQRASLPMPGNSMAENLASSEQRLNAAIEMEVARRLKERITAAALSRHALAVMQQQAMPSSSFPLLRDSTTGLTWNQAAAAAAFHRRASNPLSLASLHNSMNPLMMAAKGQRPMLLHPGAAAGMVGGLRMPQHHVRASLPKRDVVGPTFRSNIEGAKTA